MPEEDSRRHIRRSHWAIGLGAALLAALLLAVLVLDGRFVREPEPGASTSATPTGADSNPASDGGGGEPSDAGGERPVDAATVPFSSVQKLSMIMPSEERTKPRSFEVSAGKLYLLRFEVSAEKPAGTPGYGFMLGTSLTCIDDKGKTVAAIGGTQNLLTGEPVMLANQLVLTPQRDGVITCSQLANAPSAEVASQGTAFAVQATWKVTEAVGLAAPGQGASKLPLVLPTGDSQTILSRDVAVDQLTQRRLEVLVSLQLTTCTGTGGSTEEGTEWCTPEVIDPTGSHFRFEMRYDVIGADGNVCGTLDSGRREEYLDTYRHHQLYHVEKSVTVPAELCGDHIRTSVNLVNRGPAGLLVHRASTSMVTVETRPAG